MVDTFFLYLKRLLVGTVLVIFAFFVLYVPQPYINTPEARAQLGGPVTIVGPALLAIQATARNSAATAASSAATASAQATLVNKEFALDMIANTLAKSFISAMTGSIVNWINSGFNGSPAFIQDLDGFLLDVADQAAGEFISEISAAGSFICSPFQLDIQIALELQRQYALANEYSGCRLSDMVGNLEDFLDGEFSQGGWDDWFRIVNQPQQYTPYGQLLDAQAAMRTSVRNAEGREITTANWGDGFLSGKFCQAVEGASGSGENCVISKPGSVIADSLNRALGAEQDALISADEINEIVAALVGQLATQAITGATGLLGLSGGGSNSSVNRATQQSTGQTAISLQNSIPTMQQSASVQQRYNQLAVQYITRLQAYIANASNTVERRNTATDAFHDARGVRDKTASDLTRINQLLSEYQLLENQISASTLAQQQLIRQRQSQVMQAFYQVGAYGENSIASSQRSWESVMRP